MVSNIEAENSWRLYEAWYQYTNTAESFSLLVGLYDINTEFDVMQTALTFINSSQGIGAEYAASGVLGPSTFPYTSVTARLKWLLNDDLLFKVAVLDGVPSDPGNTRGTKVFFRDTDGVLMAAELAYFPGQANTLTPRSNHLKRGIEPPDPYRLALGAWRYSQPRDGWTATNQHGMGIYALAEGKLFNESQDGFQGLRAFVRAGLANAKINRFSAYTGGGLVYTGAFKGRPNDKLGLAFAIPWGSDNYEPILRGDGLAPALTETNIEATYAIQTSTFINVQFDVQYIINPNTSRSIPNALAVGSRLQLSF